MAEGCPTAPPYPGRLNITLLTPGPTALQTSAEKLDPNPKTACFKA
jgi:hypothetical protein